MNEVIQIFQNLDGKTIDDRYCQRYDKRTKPTDLGVAVRVVDAGYASQRYIELTISRRHNVYAYTRILDIDTLEMMPNIEIVDIICDSIYRFWLSMPPTTIEYVFMNGGLAP